jgi:hypothetical protein
VHRIHYRFGIVLGLIIAAIFFVMAAPSGDGARLISVTLQAAVLVAASDRLKGASLDHQTHGGRRDRGDRRFSRRTLRHRSVR